MLVTQLCPTLYKPWSVAHPLPWNSAGKNTRVDSHSLLQSIFPTQGLNLGSILPLQADSFTIWATREAHEIKYRLIFFFFFTMIDSVDYKPIYSVMLVEKLFFLHLSWLCTIVKNQLSLFAGLLLGSYFVPLLHVSIPPHCPQCHDYCHHAVILHIRQSNSSHFILLYWLH